MRRPTLAVDTAVATTTAEIAYDFTASPRSSTYTVSSDLKKSPISPDSIHEHPVDQITRKPSIALLFSLFSRRQFLFMVSPAIFTSIVSGGIAPFMTIVVGQSFNAFAQFPLSGATQADKDHLLHAIALTALELVGLAVGALALSSVTSSLWIWTGEYNVMALRKRVYEAVTNKDMVWFDTKMGAEGNVQSSNPDQGPIGAGGLMAKFAR